MISCRIKDQCFLFLTEEERTQNENCSYKWLSTYKGCTALLTDEFIRGAEDAGHRVYRFNAAFKKIHPCIGCGKCDHRGGVPCVFKDDEAELHEKLLDAELMVIASPIYYYSLSAQIKLAIDRLEPIETLLAGKKVILITSQYNPSEEMLEGIKVWYKMLQKYMGLISIGELHTIGTDTRKQMEESEYPLCSYRLGNSLRE